MGRPMRPSTCSLSSSAPSGLHGEALQRVEELLARGADSPSSLGNAALVYASFGEAERAVALLDRAVGRAMLQEHEGERAMLGRIRATAAHVLNECGYYEVAAEHARQAAEILGDEGDRSSELQALAALAEALRGSGALDEAAAAYERALVLAREFASPSFLSGLLCGLGAVLRATRPEADCETPLAQALQLAREAGTRGVAVLAALELAAAARRKNALDEAEAHAETAVELAETMRAELGVEWQRFGRRHHAARAAQLRARIAADRGDVDCSWRMAARAQARMLSECAGKSLTIESTRAALAERGEPAAMLSYLLDEEELWIALLRSDENEPRIWQRLGSKRLVALLENVPRELHGAGHYGRVQTWPALSGVLLPDDLGELLTDVQRLFVVPHGRLWHVPFQALPLEGAALIDRCELSYLPSPSLLRRTVPMVRAGPALVVGNPSGDLRHAEAEARAIAAALGTEPLLGASATREEVLRRLADAELFHFAGHGRWVAEAPGTLRHRLR